MQRVLVAVVVLVLAAEAAGVPTLRNTDAGVPSLRDIDDGVPSLRDIDDDPEKDTRWIFDQHRLWCDDVLGCLNITKEWFSLMRPVNQLPAKRKFINTRFMLHTRQDLAADTDVFIVAGDRATIAASTFDPSKPTKFITHGFIDTGNTYWLKEVVYEFLDYADYNVFRVNWGAGSKPMYSRAASNARVAGLELGYMVNWLITEYGVDPADVHLIGHSLGAHISGYAGEQIQGLGRITGLDPAGPYYTSLPHIVRLDPSDALFVDNIHTDADSILFLGYGTGQPMGHLDFLPNSGHDQPGCDPVSVAINLLTPEDMGAVRDIAACSHCRAIFLFKDSIKSTCNYLAHECFDYETFQKGDCASCGTDNTNCAYMGLHADQYVNKERTGVRLFFDTDKKEPFCYYHYELSLLTARPKGAEDWVVGHLHATFQGDNGEVLSDVKISDEHRRIDHGTVNKFQFTSHMDLGHIMRTELKWSYDDQFLKPGTYCWSLFCDRNLYITTIEVSPINYYPESARLAHTQQFCEQDGEYFKIKDGKKMSVGVTGVCTRVDD